MPWLVESQLAAAGQPECRHQPETLIAELLRELDAPALQLLDRRANVLGHQIQLVVGIPVSGVGRKLGGRKGEDQPPATRIDRGEIEHVAKERPVCLRIASENDRVNAADHGFTSLYPVTEPMPGEK